MPENPIKSPLPADLPENWVNTQTIAAAGSDVGLSEKHGYNYLMGQVNATQRAANAIGTAFAGLTPSQIEAIPAAEKGAANGVAELGDDGKIPGSQLPSLDYISTAEKGAASGVATLNSKKKIPVAQIPELDYIPTDDKGMAGGVAELGSDGIVPKAQLPFLTAPVAADPASTDYLPLIGGADNEIKKILAGHFATSADISEKLTGKQYKTTVVVGTSTAGHTLNDCDYLCDGVDDQVEINQAIQKAYEAQGLACVLLLSGTYNITSSILVPTHSAKIKTFSLHGEAGCTLNLSASVTGIENTETSDTTTPPNTERMELIVIEGLSFEGNSINSGVGVRFSTRVYCEDFLVERCCFTKMGTGVFIYAKGTVQNCRFTSVRTGAKSAERVISCYFYGCTTCIEAYWSKFVSYNYLWSCSIGVRITSDTICVGNKMNAIKGAGIEIDAAGHAVVVGNYIEMSSSASGCKGIWIHGFAAQDVYECIVSNNNIYAYIYDSTQYSIYIQKNSSIPTSGPVGTVKKCLIIGNISFGKAIYMESGLSQVYSVSNYA